MAIELPDLPYSMSALSPHISKKTLEFHHDKHHAAYVDKTNAAIKGTALDDASIEEIVKAAAEKGDQGLFNNAAQTWNHTFYWNSMAPKGGGKPKGDIAAAIDDAFGGYDGFKDAFSDAGATQFGSGWAWLVAKDGKLEVRKTLNAETPLTEAGVTPLLTMDVWEHAYYLDYQNKRPDYIATFLDKLVNWDFANENLSKA
ncbi:superoxide dismutase [Hyphococcus luteus]|uniref:Superoxide dismutase n=1 Tax=Hyphococcus luteus TaxID=2058213 RepID=A0A2S7K497_9PROT|nr:superoxide dismutase [Marinicaulis flavus]PQA87319.1 superoxide dismutase [Fe] [Marinicaulis flavus]